MLGARGRPVGASGTRRQGLSVLSAATLFLERITRRDDAPRGDEFPWNLPVFAALESLRFKAPVTFLVGENGCGKSTLLEAMAVGVEATAAGQHQPLDDETLGPARLLASGFRFGRKAFPKRKLLFRAEDILGFTRGVVTNLDDMRGIELDLNSNLHDGYGKDLALAAVSGQRRQLEIAYGKAPHARSHGETFLAILRQRLKPGGLYFLDEPEAPLSPARVLELMALIRDCVALKCQFIIASHSPMLMAQPDAQILSFQDDKILPVPWAQLEHVNLLRAFLNRPEQFLAELNRPVLTP
jgi:predicted ATPase